MDILFVIGITPEKFHDGTITATLPMGRIVPVTELTGLSGQNRLTSSLINHIKLHRP